MSRYTAPLRDKIRFLVITVQWDELMALCKRVLIASRNQGDAATEALALVGLSMAHRHRGSYQDALMCVDDAQAVAHRPHDIEADILIERGWIALQGYLQADEAIANFAEAIQIANEQGITHVDTLAKLGIATAYADIGHFDLALQWGKDALQSAQNELDTLLEGPCWLVLSRVYQRLSRPQRAESCLQHASILADTLGYTLYQSDIARTEGLLAWTATPKQALDALQESQALAQTFAQSAQAWLALSTCTSLDMALAEQAATHYLDKAQAIHSKAHEAQAFGALGRIASQQKDYTVAMDHYYTGIRLANEAKNPFQEAQLTQALGATAILAGEYDEALRAYESALSLYESLEHPQTSAIRWQVWVRRVWVFIHRWLKQLGLSR